MILSFTSWNMNIVSWHLYISILLVVVFQVSAAFHNATPEHPPMDRYSVTENSQEHPLSMQKYNIYDYPVQKRRHCTKRRKRKRPQNKDKYRCETHNDENKDCKKCGLSMADKGGRVINGRVVKPLYKYPFIVPVFHLDKMICGGAIISKTFILTAAHCVLDRESLLHARCCRTRVSKTCYHRADQFSIKLLGKKKFGKSIRIKRIIPHSKSYFAKVVYDIALLELEEPLKCTGQTSPICLPTKEMYKTGQKLFVAGWGRTKPESGSSEGTRLLKEGVMKEVEAKKCMKSSVPKKTIHQYHCAVGTKQSSCKGDSGSSNFIKFKGKFYTLGITSHGKSHPCDPARPVTFTKVLYFKKWIKKHVKDVPKP